MLVLKLLVAIDPHSRVHVPINNLDSLTYQTYAPGSSENAPPTGDPPTNRPVTRFMAHGVRVVIVTSLMDEILSCWHALL